ncbi:MAG: hypothetical protein ACK5O7_02175 [Holosporales bacterium]
MKTATNFAFNVVFPSDEELAYQEVRRAQKEAHLFTEEEAEALRAQAHAEGVEQGMRMARQALEGQALAMLEMVQTKVAEIDAEVLHLNQKAVEDVVRLVRLVLEKWLPWSSRQHAHDEILNLIEETLAQLTSRELQVFCAPEVLSFLEGIVQPPIQLKADATLQQGDCRITWQTGGIERRFARLERALDEALKRVGGVDLQQITTPASGVEVSPAVPELETEPREESTDG